MFSKCCIPLLSACLLAAVSTAQSQNAPANASTAKGGGSWASEEIRKAVDSLEAEAGTELIKVNVPAEVKASTVLLVARSSVSGIEKSGLDRLAEQVAAKHRNPGLKLITLRDLYASSAEGAEAAAKKGSLLDFGNQQAVCQYALGHQMPWVLMVDLTHLNESAIQGGQMFSAKMRASMILLNAASGERAQSFDKEAAVRGFNQADLADKAMAMLAGRLSEEASGWKLPAVEIRRVVLTVRAVIDGYTVPVLLKQENALTVGDVEVANLPMYADNASVEIDGVLAGRAPCAVPVSPGIHKVVVSRAGCNSFVKMVNAAADNRVDALLSLTPETQRQLDGQMEKLYALRELAKKAKVNEEVQKSWADALGGLGQFFRNSGIKVGKPN